MVKLDNEQTKKVLFFQQTTGAAARDCIEEEDYIVFVIAEGDMAKAIGKNGKNVSLLERLSKKKVLLIEYSEDINRFMENIFFPTKIEVKVDDKRITITTDGKNRKYVIGKGGQKIKLARLLIKRHFGPKEIKV